MGAGQSTLPAPSALRDAEAHDTLQDAAEAGNVKRVIQLLAIGADVQADRDAALTQAAENGHLEVVRLLVEAGADVHLEPVMDFAAQNGHLAVVQYLYIVGASLSNALYYALVNNHQSVVKWLVQAGANISDAVEYAALYGNVNFTTDIWNTMNIHSIQVFLAALHEARSHAMYKHILQATGVHPLRIYYVPTLDDTHIDVSTTSVFKYNPSLTQGVREVIYYKSLRHQHIITCADVEFIVLSHGGGCKAGISIEFQRYVPVGMLKLTESQLLVLFTQIADAMAYLEDNDIIQSDIKPDNVYYDTIKDVYVLADFDLAVYTQACLINRVATPTTRPPEMADVFARYKGNPTWKNRLAHTENYTYTGDVFSLAATVVMLLQGTWYPYEYEKQARYKTVPDLSGFKLFSHKLLQQCLDPSPSVRPTPTELARTLGSLHTYIPVRRVPMDTYSLRKGVMAHLRAVARHIGEACVVRVARTAAMFTTLCSITPPDTNYHPWLYTCLYIQALLCTSDTDQYPQAHAYTQALALEEGSVYLDIATVCTTLGFQCLF